MPVLLVMAFAVPLALNRAKLHVAWLIKFAGTDCSSTETSCACLHYKDNICGSASGPHELMVAAAPGGVVGRSAPAAQTLQHMRLTPIRHMGGGFDAWKAAGGPVKDGKQL